MRHRLYALFSAVSLLLCFTTAALWVRSYWVADAWGWASGKRTIQCGVASGRLRVDTTKLGEEGGSWPTASFAHARYSAALDPPTSRLPTTAWNLGFATEHRYRSRHFDSHLVMIPLWFALLLASLLSWTLRRRARRAKIEDRLRGGLCPACGYDIRATPHQCPECGSPRHRSGAARSTGSAMIDHIC